MQVSTMKGTIFTVVGAVLTISVICNAYILKKQFYPLTVYITKSNPSLAVVYSQAFILVLLVAKLMRKIFFGQLRAAEVEHLIERSWFAVTETCLAFTLFRDDFSPKFVALFMLLLVIKAFHWLIEDRVDFIERSPVISLLFHVRVVSLMMLLGFLNFYFFNHAYQSTVSKGATVQLVFGFEYAILFTIIINIFIKYVLHTLDLRSETPWENKAVYLLYTEFVVGLVKVFLYAVFIVIMLKIYTFPLFAIRPIYLALRSLKKSLSDIILSRRAIRNMNQLFPDATAEDLAATDNVCIICREEMTSSISKKLPCNHIFHASCLRSWFQRQQTCPTCRMSVLTRVASTPFRNAEGLRNAEGGRQVPIIAQQIPNIRGMLFGAGGLPGQFPMWQPMQQPPQQAPAQAPAAAAQQPAAAAAAPNQDAGGVSSTGASSTSTTTTTTQPGATGPTNMNIPPLPPFMPPPFLPIMFPPPPMPPANFNGFSDEEVRRMEGQERENVEARIQSLRNIQILLDAAVLQMQQYSALVTSLRVPADVQPSSSQDTPTTMTASSSSATMSSTTAFTPAASTPPATMSSTTAFTPSVSTPSASAPSASSLDTGTSVTDSASKTGAKPKVYCPAPKSFTTNMSSAPSPSSPPTSPNMYFDANPDGTVSKSSPAESTADIESSDQAEVRRRRLERFNQPSTASNDNLDLD